LSFQDGDNRRELLSRGDLEIEIAKCVNDRALRVRKCEANLRTSVDLPSEPDDIRKEFSCFIQKRFRIL
jgi:hypothetical protein